MIKGKGWGGVGNVIESGSFSYGDVCFDTAHSILIKPKEN
jgi:hypothetical protein